VLSVKEVGAVGGKIGGVQQEKEKKGGEDRREKNKKLGEKKESWTRKD
jgi:hypothetical protein